MLKNRFKDIETRKIDTGEWTLEDQNSKARLNLSEPWLSVIKPYSVLKMRMIFYRQKKSLTECPACYCRSIRPLASKISCLWLSVYSHVCGLNYWCFQAHLYIEKAILLSLFSQAIREFKNALLVLGRPKRPPPRGIRHVESAAFEDDISRYRHVLLIYVDFASLLDMLPEEQSTKLAITINAIGETLDKSTTGLGPIASMIRITHLVRHWTNSQRELVDLLVQRKETCIRHNSENRGVTHTTATGVNVTSERVTIWAAAIRELLRECVKFVKTDDCCDVDE
ncbi:hypothetical protein CI102_291 [Trichoderma harzianum]|nr:hypothetical protein CI102_291 [Trichoderma harzianum]